MADPINKPLNKLGEYEGMLDVDESLVTSLITATQVVADAVHKQ
jgi:hypothetical protein